MAGGGRSSGASGIARTRVGASMADKVEEVVDTDSKFVRSSSGQGEETVVDNS